MKGTQNPKQFPNRLFFEVSSFDTNTMDVFSQIEEVLLWQLGSGLKN